MKRLSITLAALAGLLCLTGSPAFACAACFGNSDSSMAKGMNAGIFALLAFVVLFWIAFGSFFVFIARRSRQSGEELPGDQNDPQHNCRRALEFRYTIMTKILQFFGMPEAASAHAPAIDDFIGYVHILMLVLFIGWLAYYLLALFLFRRSARPKADYAGVKSNMSTYLEIGVAVIEAVLLVGFAVPLWARAVEDFPQAKGDPATDPIEIQIMGQQFKWSAHYTGPDNKWGKQDVKSASATNPFGLVADDANGKDDVVCALGEAFKVPMGRAVICKISSMDVIHSFKITSMRVTQDAIPGMTIPAHFTATKPGKYVITCAQLCGNGHSVMRGDFEVVTPQEYAVWYAEKAKSGGAGESFE